MRTKRHRRVRSGTKNYGKNYGKNRDVRRLFVSAESLGVAQTKPRRAAALSLLVYQGEPLSLQASERYTKATDQARMARAVMAKTTAKKTEQQLRLRSRP